MGSLAVVVGPARQSLPMVGRWSVTSAAALAVCLVWCLCIVRVCPTPVATPNWEILVSTNGVKFSGRNAHASCIFKGKIWVTGGRVAAYTTYNLLESYKMADVWYSEDGAIWAAVSTLSGDFYAQNIDVVQPGSIAPWFERYAHSLNPVDIDGDGVDDVMVLAGGFASSPVNDVWITYDGIEWVYAGNAPWSERAWHSTTIFQNKLWLMGGTPLNNEVWCLESLTRIPRTRDPLTRATFSNFTFSMNWTKVTTAPWSPRVGMGLVSQYYFDSKTESYTDAKERMVLIGGYGGYPKDGSFGSKSLYNGFVTRADLWVSFDGRNWTKKVDELSFGGRAWMAMSVQRGWDPRLDSHSSQPLPPKMYVFGGGYTGFSTASKKRVVTVDAYADAYWSRDGITWVQINYEEGGGTTGIVYFSSQEWAKTVVDRQTQYLGMWGHTVHSFNATTGLEYPGSLHFIAGAYDAGGSMSNIVYRNLPGLHCDIHGAACGGAGTCNVTGCTCPSGYAGTYCEDHQGSSTSAASAHFHINALLTIGCFLISIWAQLV